MGTYVVLISCDDQPGLVHQITGVLFRHKVNVTENQEFVDHHGGRFFMRTQFEGLVNPSAIVREITKLVPPKAFCDVREQKRRQLVVMASNEPHCLGDLLVRHSTGELQADILAVLSQTETCRELTERFDLPFECIPVRDSREEHEERIWKAIEPLQPDYLVLARYMRIFSPAFVGHFKSKIVNIHHSFLPAFVGRDPYQQAHQRGVKIIGATSHFVIEGLDQGPIITQDVISVDHTHSPETMARRGQDIEKVVLARGLRFVLEDRVLIDGNRTVVFG